MSGDWLALGAIAALAALATGRSRGSKAMVYSSGMSLEDERALLAEIAAQERSYAQVAMHDQRSERSTRAQVDFQLRRDYPDLFVPAFRVLWDNGYDSGDLGGEYENPQAAEDAGQEWITQRQWEDHFDEEGEYTFEVVEESVRRKAQTRPTLAGPRVLYGPVEAEGAQEYEGSEGAHSDFLRRLPRYQRKIQ